MLALWILNGILYLVAAVAVAHYVWERSRSRSTSQLPPSPAVRELPDAATARLILAGDTSIPKCVFCAGYHMRYCPRVKAMVGDLSLGGTISSVEFFREGQWSDAAILWPEDLHEIASQETD